MTDLSATRERRANGSGRLTVAHTGTWAAHVGERSEKWGLAQNARDNANLWFPLTVCGYFDASADPSRPGEL